MFSVLDVGPFGGGFLILWLIRKKGFQQLKGHPKQKTRQAHVGVLGLA